MINNAIEQRAEKLLIDSNNFKVPVVPERCAEYLKVTVNNVELEDSISGFLAIKDSVAQIGYNQHHGKNRQRFTIAHEIGHYVLHAQSDPIFIDKNEAKSFAYLYRDGNSSSGENFKEREANNFAAALLMPRKLLLEEILKKGQDMGIPALVEELAQSFEVSSQAMSIRLSHLNFFNYENASME